MHSLFLLQRNFLQISSERQMIRRSWYDSMLELTPSSWSTTLVPWTASVPGPSSRPRGRTRNVQPSFFFYFYLNFTMQSRLQTSRPTRSRTGSGSGRPNIRCSAPRSSAFASTSTCRPTVRTEAFCRHLRPSLRPFDIWICLTTIWKPLTPRKSSGSHNLNLLILGKILLVSKIWTPTLNLFTFEQSLTFPVSHLVEYKLWPI